MKLTKIGFDKLQKKVTALENSNRAYQQETGKLKEDRNQLIDTVTEIEGLFKQAPKTGYYNESDNRKVQQKVRDSLLELAESNGEIECLKKENEKLWWMIRVAMKDESIKPVEVESNLNGYQPERIINRPPFA